MKGGGDTVGGERGVRGSVWGTLKDGRVGRRGKG